MIAKSIHYQDGQDLQDETPWINGMYFQ